MGTYSPKKAYAEITAYKYPLNVNHFKMRRWEIYEPVGVKLSLLASKSINTTNY